ncbi:nicotinamidase-related amidase [Anaerosolibacter carboniphilus]|uniref:Nicotinamidase-related amidase n=1 Tax=Anaerosolibacter carboniphilus TaxID=1417629 RepID=A0A841KMV0_9FIRM|nr:cysteine hydrolase [Anaerosolibacter carboniphilus]MBB6214767.1 nicotinamidase-related amidase [Anaerosolibacter carboniphilus]
MEEKECPKPQKALLVIDIQEDYTGITAKSPFPYKDSERLITTVNKIIEDASKKNMPIVYIRQEFDGFLGKIISRVVGHGTAIKGKPGTELDKRITIMSNHFFSKPMPDAFSNPKLEAFLAEQQVKELYLVGLDAAGCVYHTAKGALKHGYNVSIFKDGIVLLNENKWDSLLNKFEQDSVTLISSNEF